MKHGLRRPFSGLRQATGHWGLPKPVLRDENSLCAGRVPGSRGRNPVCAADIHFARLISGLRKPTTPLRGLFTNLRGQNPLCATKNPFARPFFILRRVFAVGGGQKETVGRCFGPLGNRKSVVCRGISRRDYVIQPTATRLQYLAQRCHDKGTATLGNGAQNLSTLKELQQMAATGCNPVGVEICFGR
jgi:hypothetical protein